MTKNEMKEVLREDVKTAWETFRLVKSIYGDDDEKIGNFRGQWFALDALWHKFYPNEDY